MNVMKRALCVVIMSLLLAAGPTITKACEITVAVDGAQKEKYKTGDIVVITITVVLEHRNCDISLDQTNIRVSGSQITGATKWGNTDGRTWQKRIKIKIDDGKSGKAIITAERTCERDGGKGSLTLFTGG